MLMSSVMRIEFSHFILVNIQGNKNNLIKYYIDIMYCMTCIIVCEIVRSYETFELHKKHKMDTN
jgi:ribosomal protein S26